jgi:hypothetical protein
MFNAILFPESLWPLGDAVRGTRANQKLTPCFDVENLSALPDWLTPEGSSKIA